MANSTIDASEPQYEVFIQALTYFLGPSLPLAFFIKICLICCQGRQKHRKNSPSQLEKSIPLPLLIFGWIVNGLYATAFLIEAIMALQTYAKSQSDDDHVSCLVFFLIMSLGFANYFASLCLVADHRSFDSLDFLRYRLVTICFLLSNVQSIRFWLYLTWPGVHAGTSSSRVYYMGLVLDIIYQSWSIEKVKNYEVRYDTVTIQKKYRARDEVLNLYASQTILAYLFLVLLNLVLLCCQLLSVNANKSALLTFSVILYYMTAVRPFAAHMFILLCESDVSKNLIQYVILPLFVLIISPCLLLCLIIRTAYLGAFSLCYVTLRPVSSVQENLKRDENLNQLIASLKIKDKQSAVQNFLDSRIRPFDIDI